MTDENITHKFIRQSVHQLRFAPCQVCLPLEHFSGFLDLALLQVQLGKSGNRGFALRVYS